MRSGLLKLFGLCVLSGVLVASLAMPMAFGAGAFVNETTSAMSNMSATMAKGQMPLTTKVTDRNGKPLAYFYDDYRIPTPKERISQTMKVAITAIEDKRFWDHRVWTGRARCARWRPTSAAVR